MFRRGPQRCGEVMSGAVPVFAAGLSWSRHSDPVESSRRHRHMPMSAKEVEIDFCTATACRRVAAGSGRDDRGLAVSEELRSGLYAWLREQTDEPRAEYLMSCLAPAPPSDLVTKEFLVAELSRFATKEEFTALDSRVAPLDVKVAGVDVKVETLLAAQRGEDRRAGRVRHSWLAGIWLSAAVPIWLGAAGVIG